MNEAVYGRDLGLGAQRAHCQASACPSLPPPHLVFQFIACEHPGPFREFMRKDGVAMHAVELDAGEPIPVLKRFDYSW